MFRKEEKKALTRLGLLSIGWPLGLDRFYEGKTREGVFSAIGWLLVFGSIMFLAPCPSQMDGSKYMAMSDANPLVILPLALGAYGALLVLKKGFRLLKQFETAED